MSTERSSLTARVVSLLGLALVMFFVIGAIVSDDGIGRHEMLEAELAKVTALNKSIGAENRELARQADALRGDRRYVEGVIRDELGWVRSDELVFLFDREKDQRR